MRQRLSIEEQVAEIRHIEGAKNVVADTLLRLPYATEELQKLENYASKETEEMNDFDLFQLPKIAECQLKNEMEMQRYSK